MNSLYQACYTWMEQRHIGFIDLMMPFYISAVCCHAINLENRKREFYFEHGQPADLRLHVFLTAPAGYMKTFILKRFLDRRNSMFGQSAVKTAFIGSMTEAGFVGTIQNIDGVPTQLPGAAYDFMDHVLGIDEFSALTNMMQMEHSKNLDNALLTALDSGYLIKRLGPGELRYETHLTLFGGSQPSRFSLTSGLGRRFLFIYFVPTTEQQAQMRQFRRLGKGVHGDPSSSEIINGLTEKLATDLEYIQDIVYADGIYNALDDIDIPHYEEPLYEKIALGYHIATQKVEREITVKYTPTIGDLWKLEADWRFKVKSGAQDSQVMQFITASPGIAEADLKMKMLDFGMAFIETTEAINSLYRQRRIGIITDSKDKKQRKRFIWPYH